MKKVNFKKIGIVYLALISSVSFAQKKPNILLITVDDVAQNALSCYSLGMQYPTPNIDKIANNGALFTDYYAQPSCTAGRAAMLTGQLPVRTGLTTVGQPGNPLGLKPEDPTIAELLKPLGYMTAQYGKNHLGDRNEHLPTVHGFDEFYGNLYHLNVSEEPEQNDYPKTKEFADKYGPRGIIESYATTSDDATTDPRFGRIGKQTVKDLGPLTVEKMKTVDDEFISRTQGFMKKAKDNGKPFFIWLAPTRQHVYIHLKDENKYLAANISEDMDKFGSGLMEHDMQVGKIIDYLASIGELENTIIMYNSDNGPEQSTWPDAGVTQFRGEKMTTYEGGIRSPFLVSWPGKIPAGSKLNGITDGLDILPTIYAAVTGNNNLIDDLKNGKKAGNMTYKVHLDGYNALDYWTGKTKESPRKEIFYYYESRLTAVRFGPWKIHFATKECYYCDLEEHNMMQVFNLRKDPYEKYDGIVGFHQAMSKSWVMQPIIGVVKDHLMSFKSWPVRQGSASLNINEVIDKMNKVQNGN
jgi:arylsulfatase A-like enzyme